MDTQSFFLHTLGPPRLVDPQGAEVPLSPKQLALVTLLRLLEPDPRKPKSEYLKSIGAIFKAESTDPTGIVHKQVARIRELLRIDFRHGQIFPWIRNLPCDAEILRAASMAPTPESRSILLRYRPFLEGFGAQIESSRFDVFVSQKAAVYASAMRTVWASEAQTAAAAGDWDTLLALGNLGLAVDPAWEEAYLELHRACCGMDPPRPLPSLERGRALVASLGNRKALPGPGVVKAIQQAQDLYARLTPSPGMVPPGAIDMGSEEVVDLRAHPVSSGSVAWDPAHIAGTKDLDVFLAVPMDSLGKEYQGQRPKVLQLLESLRQLPGCSRVYYAGESLPTPDDYDDEGIALRDCTHQLRRARFFLMIYPQKVASSVILEAGIALALGIPGVIFYKKSEDLPFLLRGVTKAFPAMHTCKFTQFYNLLSLLSDQVSARLQGRG
jgi:hypothetical protein